MALLETGNVKWRKKTTGQFAFKRTGESTYINLGNVRMHSQELTAERTKLQVARKGYVETIHEQPAVLERRWKIGLDEELPDVTRLDLLAGAHATANQASGTAATESFTAVKQGQVIYLAKQDVTITSVKVGATAYVEGTDYSVDAKAGKITLLRGGDVAIEGATIDVIYDHAAVTRIQHTTNGEIKLEGAFLFDEFDQNSDIPRARYTGSGMLIMSNRGDSDGKKFSEFEVELLITGTLTRLALVQS